MKSKVRKMSPRDGRHAGKGEKDRSMAGRTHEGWRVWKKKLRDEGLA